MSITKPKYHINHFFDLSSLTFFYEQNAIVLCQNNNLLNHAANFEIFSMRNISQNTISLFQICVKSKVAVTNN